LVCVAIRRKQAGSSFVVLQRSGTRGGAWRENGYQDAGCDAPSLPYPYSIVLKFGWEHVFAKCDEIHDYSPHWVKKHGALGGIRRNEELPDATFEDRHKEVGGIVTSNLPDHHYHHQLTMLNESRSREPGENLPP
jgi:cation diffusion facilitator CzcD-associated flavoprotein CzcO